MVRINFLSMRGEVCVDGYIYVCVIRPLHQILRGLSDEIYVHIYIYTFPFVVGLLQNVANNFNEEIKKNEKTKEQTNNNDDQDLIYIEYSIT